ncbi:hypothetical protein AB0K12_32575 [Nonomuraea sp. NPDC049419]|uniref:hypothetical protein n=1 Tax=Nonomuraea sp. NPDC049419 TaxID=3155772 RepID=UPI0034212820
MAQPTSPEGEEWPCPGFAAHPCNWAAPAEVALDWRSETRKVNSPNRQRVIAYTCSCQETSYEFLAAGGLYRFRRVSRRTPETVAYAGPWHRVRAEMLWGLLIVGQAQ